MLYYANKMTVIITCILSGILFGCYSTHKTRGLAYIDSLSYTRKDSLFLRHLIQANTNRSVELRHITFSPPDTTGKQTVETLTLVSASTQQKVASEKTEKASSIENNVNNTTFVEEKQQIKSNFKYLFIVFLSIIPVLILTIRYLKRR